MPGGLHPHAYADAFLLQLAIEMFGLGAVRQPLLSALPGFCIYRLSRASTVQDSSSEAARNDVRPVTALCPATAPCRIRFYNF